MATTTIPKAPARTTREASRTEPAPGLSVTTGGSSPGAVVVATGAEVKAELKLSVGVELGVVVLNWEEVTVWTWERVMVLVRVVVAVQVVVLRPSSARARAGRTAKRILEICMARGF